MKPLDPSYLELDRMTVEEVLRVMNQADREVPVSVGRELDKITQAVEAIVLALRNGGRLFYIGAGTSGRLGVLDASECPPTFDVGPELVQGVIAGGEKALSRATEASEDDDKAGVADLKAVGFRAQDVLVGIAASGRTPYVLGAVKWARELGARTVGISCVAGSELAAAVEIAIEPVTGPEVLIGSSRLKAGTATKLVLNMISTTVMIQLGHVYGNLMVNVRPTNQKLRDRACGIIEKIAEVTPERARQLLEESGGHVRTAIVMEKCGTGAQEARRILKKWAENGHLGLRRLLIHLGDERERKSG